MVLDGVGDALAATATAEQLHQRVCAPVTITEQTITSRASVGVAMAGTTPATLDELLFAADLAMYQAKAAGGGVVTSGVDPVLSRAAEPAAS